MLYTLHWILLDAAEECADADRENGVVPRDPFPYIFPLTCIQVTSLTNAMKKALGFMILS